MFKSFYRCEEELSRGIDTENVGQLWVASDMFNAQNLKQQVMEFLKANRDGGDVALQIREAVKVRPELTSDVFSLMKLE